MRPTITKNTDSYKLDVILDDYNWDDGFELPCKIINHTNCELATALKAFYLADGEMYLQHLISEKESRQEWVNFLDCLYNRIKSGRYTDKLLRFKIPLTKVQKYKILKISPDTPTMFLEDVNQKV